MLPLPGPRSVLSVVGLQKIISSTVIVAERHGIQYRLKLLHAEPVQPQSVPKRNQEPSSDQATRLQILQIDKCLSIAHENYLLMSAAKQQFADAKQADIWK